MAACLFWGATRVGWSKATAAFHSEPQGVLQVQADVLLVLELKDGSLLVWPPSALETEGEPLARAEVPRQELGSMDDPVRILIECRLSFMTDMLIYPPPPPATHKLSPSHPYSPTWTALTSSTAAPAKNTSCA